MMEAKQIWRSARIFLRAAVIAAVATMLLPQAAQAEKRKLLVGGFKDIVIDGDMRVVVNTGKGPSGVATGDRRILDLLKLNRVSEVLYIRVQRPPNNENSVRIKEPLIITLTNRDIRNITLRGNARLQISTIKHVGPSRIQLNGGGSIKIGAMDVDQLDVALFGTGSIDFGGGAVRQTDLRIQGSPIYGGANLTSRKFNLILVGNATVSALVNEGAIISNEGAGNITITGKGNCLIRKAGSAIIVCPQDKK